MTLNKQHTTPTLLSFFLFKARLARIAIFLSFFLRERLGLRAGVRTTRKPGVFFLYSSGAPGHQEGS